MTMPNMASRQAVILPTVTLTIPPPNHSAKNQASRPLIPPSKLKIRITPHLLVSTPPFAQGVTGRKVEDCVHVVVDIGGNVDLGVEVDDESMEWAGGDSWEMEEVLKARMKGLFEANLPSLALSSISAPDLDLPSTPQESSLSSSSSTPTLRTPLLRLSPLLANPSHSHLIKTLTTTGRPQAVLARLDIRLEWVAPSIRAVKEDDEEGKEDEQGDGDSQESAEAEDENRWDEDEFCDPEEGEGGSDVGVILDEIEGDGVEGAVLPKWVEAQLRTGIFKLLRTHMIKRFPLLFDSALIQHATSLALHRSLTSSLTHFLTLSSIHSTTFLRPARHLLRSIAQEQEKFLSLNVTSASLIRGTAISGVRPKKGKRRKIEQDNEEGQGGPDPHTAKGRAEAHMSQVHAKVTEEDKGPRADERRVGRLVGEAMGRVGRGKWDLGRRGIGRMAAFRVPLKDVEIMPEGKEGEYAAASLRENTPDDHDTHPGAQTNFDNDQIFDYAFFAQLSANAVVDEESSQDPNIMLDDWDEFEPISPENISNFDKSDSTDKSSLDRRAEESPPENLTLDMHQDHDYDEAEDVPLDDNSAGMIFEDFDDHYESILVPLDEDDDYTETILSEQIEAVVEVGEERMGEVVDDLDMDEEHILPDQGDGAGMMALDIYIGINHQQSFDDMLSS